MTSNNVRAQDGSYNLALDGRLLVSIVWKARVKVFVSVVISALLALILALSLPNVYRAEAQLAPVNEDAMGGLANLAAQYGAIASLAGINLSDGSSDKTAYGMAVLQSRKFIIDFISRRNIKVDLFAAKGWNGDSRKLLIDEAIYDQTRNEWVRHSWFGDDGEPSSLEAYEEFIEILQVRQEGDTGFIRVSIDHYSPSVASTWVKWLVEDVNSVIKSQDVIEAEQSIKYLEHQLNETSLSELRSMFSHLIQKQMEIVMLSEVTDEYLFRTIDPAMEPERKHRPNRALICILGVALGGIFGALLAIAGSARKWW